MKVSRLFLILLLSHTSTNTHNSDYVIHRYAHQGFDNEYYCIKNKKRQKSNLRNVYNLIKFSISKGLKGSSNLIKFTYNNYDKVLSKKFLAAMIILGTPYLYFDKSSLDFLTEKAINFALSMSEAIADGILRSASKNPKQLAKIMSVMVANQTGKQIALETGKAIAKGLLLALSFGKYKA